MAININLKNLIKNRGYTIVKLSNEINITPANLSKIINNKVSEIKLETLNKICETLKCMPGDVLEYKCQIKNRIIPFFLDYVGGTDDILAEGIENVKKFFKFIKEFQEIKNIEIKIILITGLSFESGKSRYRLLNKLAESYGLPDLFYGISMEYCGFFMSRDKTIQLKAIDSKMVEKRSDIEMIANQYNVEISKQYSSIYNLLFNEKITRSELAKVSEKLDTVIDSNEIETVTYFDRYGCEIDIRNKNHSKSDAILMIMNNLETEYDIPLIVMGGAPSKVNWDMYTKSKDELNRKGYNIIDIITTEYEETKEIDHSDKNVISIDLSKYINITKLFIEINKRLNMTK